MPPAVTVISGSPSPKSRTLRLLRHFADRLAAYDLAPTILDVRELPAEDLLFARTSSPPIAKVLGVIEASRGIVVGTPIYKAAYSGVLKTFLDLLPPNALAGKVALPVVTGGTQAHALALDYALRPVLAALGDPLVVGGLFVFDKHIGERPDGSALLDPDVERQVEASAAAFARAIRVTPA
jgi:FMN reductase